LQAICASTISELLTEWGDHEAVSRRDQISSAFGALAFELPSAALITLCRGPLIVPIFLAHPRFVHKIELVNDDLRLIRVYNGSSPENWHPEDERARLHIERLVAEERVPGPLLCAARTSTGQLDGLEAPLLMFDGLHRLSAWRKHLEMGRAYPIDALVVGCDRIPRF